MTARDTIEIPAIPALIINLAGVSSERELTYTEKMKKRKTKMINPEKTLLRIHSLIIVFIIFNTGRIINYSIIFLNTSSKLLLFVSDSKDSI